ncbi:MAG: DUF512 domain-containing protein, partial [Bacillota bacterium]
EYNEFPQIENGIGLTRLLWQELKDIEEKIPNKIENNAFSIVTGVLGKKVLKPVINRFKEIEGLSIELLVVENNFFGKSVTVSGLLTAQDMYKSIEKNAKYDNIIIPEHSLNDKNYFLDGKSYSEFKNSFKKKNIYKAKNLKEILEVF